MVSVSLYGLRPLTTYPRVPSGIGSARRVNGVGMSRITVNSYAGSSCASVVGITSVLGNGAVYPAISLYVTPNSGRILGVLTLGKTLTSVVGTNTEVLRSTYNPYVNVNRDPGSGNISLHAFGEGFRNEDNAGSTDVCLISPRITTYSTLANCLASPERVNRTPGISVPRGFVVGSGVVRPPTDRRRTGSIRILEKPGVGPFPGARPLPTRVRTGTILGINSGVAASRVVPTNTGVLPCHSGVPRLSRFYFNIYSRAFPREVGGRNGNFVVNNTGCNRNSDHRRTTLIPLCLNIGTIVAGDFTEVRITGLIGTNVLPFAFGGRTSCSGVTRNSRLTLPRVERHLEDGRDVILGGVAGKRRCRLSSSRLSRERESVLLYNNLLSCAERVGGWPVWFVGRGGGKWQGGHG